jgi:hypothetical protein
MQKGSPTISLARLEELFRPVLSRESIDLSWPEDRQMSAFLESEAPFIALTQDGKYSALVSRLNLLSTTLNSALRRRLM